MSEQLRTPAPLRYLPGAGPEAAPEPQWWQETEPGAQPEQATEPEPGAQPQQAPAAVTSIHGEQFADDAVTDPLAVEQLSMRALNRRAYAYRELLDYLRDHQVPQLLAEQECERLAGVGLLDDAALAEDLVERLQRRKGLGAAGLRQQLKQQRLDPEAIEAALGSVEADDELSRAIALAERRRSSVATLDREAARRRLSGYLQRRGYDSQTIGKAIQAVLGSR